MNKKQNKTHFNEAEQLIKAEAETQLISISNIDIS